PGGYRRLTRPRCQAKGAGPAWPAPFVVPYRPTDRRGEVVTTFVDRVTLHVEAGKGGHGVASVHREKFKPLGGPDGGNGGNGGDVVLVVDPNETTLLDYHRSPHRRAAKGAPGGGDERNGAGGADLVLPVPAGTVVTDRSGDVLADLVTVGDRKSVV